MADSQNPVYTDNASVLGDGTEEHPLSSGPGSLGGVAFRAQMSPPTTPQTLASGSLGVDILDLTFDVPPGTWDVLLWGSLQIDNSASAIIGLMAIQNLPSTKGQGNGTTPSTAGSGTLALSCLGLDLSVAGGVSKTYHLVAGNNGADPFDVTWGTLFAMLVPAGF